MENEKMIYNTILVNEQEGAYVRRRKMPKIALLEMRKPENKQKSIEELEAYVAEENKVKYEPAKRDLKNDLVVAIANEEEVSLETAITTFSYAYDENKHQTVREIIQKVKHYLAYAEKVVAIANSNHNNL